MKALDRRGFLKKVGIVSGAAAALTLEGQVLADKVSHRPDASAGGGAGMPMGKIGHLEVSRLICGGNLIGGWAHSRDLIYVSSLMKHYFTDEKILETLEICEQNGINTIVTVVDERTFGLLKKHWKNGGKIQWLAQLRGSMEDPLPEARIAADNGAVGAHLVGNAAEKWVLKEGGIEAVGRIVEYLHDRRLVAGCSGHKLHVPVLCEEAGVNLDYHFKTLNTADFHCDAPEEVVEFMKKVKTPWIAFKVLAAGAVNPTKGFKYALKGGADFMCVGMFDFQIKDDVQIVSSIFARGIQRDRAWA
jgi:hypothetical protein